MKGNPRYSLRAFARALQVSPTLLSLVMAGRRRPSGGFVLKVTQTLKLTPLQIKALYQAVTQAKVPDNLQSLSIDDQFSEISLETFSVISDWWHFAILNLLAIPNAKFEARWISKRLGIREMEARIAMDRLVKLNLVGKVGGKWKRISPPIKLENTVSTTATRNFHGEVLKLALSSLENDPLKIREHTGMTMAIHPSVIPKAKEIIKAFKLELMNLLEHEHEPSEVYQLAIQLFPVTKVGAL